ncbi:MAG: oligopeptide transporter, OPT family [Prevotellaceae bacterium]|jgi:putative OPT family oligopeptide transporter|nr:oligopeptide transporter, OPT family [Prevotellaceae bacterium]
MNVTEENTKGLPENAQRELNPGEKYEPIMSPAKNYSEVTVWSVVWGLAMAVVFSAAAAYLGLKVGQVFEAAIPIAIIAVGASSLAKRKGALGENVIIQSIGASSGVIVAGAIFTLPALYILGLEVKFVQLFLSSLLGGILGILFLIPFRKYFVSDMHGKYPFPEATATTQVLVSGEKGGNQMRILLVSGLIGGLYDFIIATFGWWQEVVSTRIFAFGEQLADKTKFVFKINVGAAVLGLGYIVGLKYAAIICAGSFVSWYVLVPLVAGFGGESMVLQSAESIFFGHIRLIGIGGIAMAGVVGIIKSAGIIKGAFGLAAKELRGKKENLTDVKRTQRDLSMKIILAGIAVTLAVVFLFFWIGVINNLLQSVIAVLIVGVVAFLFTTVAANAIAIVGTNPVSGMTLMTLIITSLVMVAAGLSGTAGMVSALIIGGVVCTALSMAGGFVTDLKIGYWLGSSPHKQQMWKFAGTFVSAITVGGVIMLLNDAYGFTTKELSAPQANAMAAVIKSMMSGETAPWLLYGVGAALALILTMINVPALAFSLGMFIPLELNTPLLVGGLISWYVSTRSKDKTINASRQERGTLIASGFIAGGALMGVVSAILRLAKVDPSNKVWTESTGSEILAIVMYIAIILYFIFDSMKHSTTNNKNLKS